MILPMFFMVLALTSAGIAALMNDSRRVVLALWVCGMSVGCIFLSFGAEVLSIVQWLVSTLTGVSFLFFSSMFGELGAENKSPQLKKKVIFDLAQATMIGGGFIGLLGVVLQHFRLEASAPMTPGYDLQAFGQLLTERHSVCLEIMAITLLLVLIAGGVLSRPEESA